MGMKTYEEGFAEGMALMAQELGISEEEFERILEKVREALGG